MRRLSPPSASRIAGLGLSGALALVAPAAALAQPANPADGPEDELAVRIPVRLTAGPSDHLMGVATPDGESLFFIGDEHGTTEVLVQSPISSGARPLFDALGDHAFPRVSPDGRHVAYISYVRDATGDACVRSVRGGSERCLTGPDTAELEVLWLDEGSRLGVLSRSALHSGFSLSSHPISGGRSEVLIERDMIGLSRSPDGRFLAYVAIEARRGDVGVTFASRVGRGLRVERMGDRGPEGSPVVFEPDLPGLSGFPAFSADGRHVYFSQYLNDTNRDGTIDGEDNSVLVRVGFDGTKANPFEGQPLEQLTSSRWNCHYPAPTRESLLMTCSHGGSLDIYSLPLDGVVPADWSDDRLRAELAVARDLWAKLLLASRLAARLPPSDAHLDVLEPVVWLHLALREYESALYYGERIASLAGPDSPRGRWARLFNALAKHRRADVALARGQLSRSYVEQERARLAEVRELGAGAPTGGTGPSAADLAAIARLVASEILDDLGQKRDALVELRAVDVSTLTDPHALHLVGDRAEHVDALLGDREALLEVRAKLAAHPSLSLSDRLEQASDYVAELVRGRGREARIAAIDAARARAADGSELALLLDVERPLATLTDANQEEVRARIFELYTAEPDAERRRAIALRTVRTASRSGNEFLQYQFATTWASSVRPDDPQRRYAEELYRAIVVERAYGELGQGDLQEAAGYFFQASRNAEALDAHIGFIEARLARGPEDLDAFYDQRFASHPDDPGYLFAKAYLAARTLPSVSDRERHAQIVARVVELLRRVDAAWPRRVEVHHLWGFTLHRAALETGSREDAGSANAHYLLALDLAQERPRARAAVLEAVGTLQASLGNHRRALEHFELRARLPFTSPESELAFDLARSRSFFHAREPEEARASAELGLALVDRTPSLARFRAAALDRLAFSHVAAGEFVKGAARYEELLRTLAGPDDRPIDRLKAEIGLASSSLSAGQAETALAAVERAETLLRANPGLAAHGPGSLVEHYVYSHARYGALLLGLRAEALVALRRYPEAETALGERQRALEGFHDESGADEDLLALAQVELRRAEVAQAAGRGPDAVRFAEAGLARIDDFNERTGSGVTETSLRLLHVLAELVLDRTVPRTALHRDLEADLVAAYEFMARFPSPRTREDRMRFEIYLTMLRSGAPTPNASPGSPR